MVLLQVIIRIFVEAIWCYLCITGNHIWPNSFHISNDDYNKTTAVQVSINYIITFSPCDGCLPVMMSQWRQLYLHENLNLNSIDSQLDPCIYYDLYNINVLVDLLPTLLNSFWHLTVFAMQNIGWMTHDLLQCSQLTTSYANQQIQCLATMYSQCLSVASLLLAVAVDAVMSLAVCLLHLLCRKPLYVYTCISHFRECSQHQRDL